MRLITLHVAQPSLRSPIALQFMGHPAQASLRNCLTNSWYLKLPLASTGTSLSISSTCTTRRSSREQTAATRTTCARRQDVRSGGGGQQTWSPVSLSPMLHRAEASSSRLQLPSFWHTAKSPNKAHVGSGALYARVGRDGSHPTVRFQRRHACAWAAGRPARSE